MTQVINHSPDIEITEEPWPVGAPDDIQQRVWAIEQTSGELSAAARISEAKILLEFAVEGKEPPAKTGRPKVAAIKSDAP